MDSNGRTIWIADAHCGDGKRFVVRADEKLTAFLELEAAIRADFSLELAGPHEIEHNEFARVERKRGIAESGCNFGKL